ncbi:MAG: peptidylprolyl isomerase [Candidatus Zixiibacteriota bacterium]
MKNIILILSLAMVFVFSGCSKKDETKSDKQEKETKMADTTMPQSKNDSLTAIRYPVRDLSNPYVTLVTDFGDMTIEMYRDVAPAHVDSFIARSVEGFYDGTIFHRIIDNFMIQGGDPQGTGLGNAGYYLKAEFSDLPHHDGTLSMARSTDPNSASCQFFICLARNRGTSGLDKKYTVFGQLIKGYDVLHEIGSVECIPNPSNPREISKPKEDVYLRKVYLSDIDGNELK